MYARRRIEEVLDKILGGTSFEVNKFAHNENNPDMELKYDIWCNTEKESKEVAEMVNSALGANIADPMGDEEGRYLTVIYLSWSTDKPVSACDEEDKMVKYYLSNNSNFVLLGSYEEDLKALSDKEYIWGCLNGIWAII